MPSPDWKPQLSAAAFASKTDYALYVEGYNDAMRQTAAPDLYEALQWIMDNRHLCHIPSFDGDWDEMANAALAKARGE